MLVPLVIFLIICFIMIGVHYEDYTSATNFIR